MDDAEAKVSLELTADEAVVLDALLTGFDPATAPQLSDVIRIEDPSERAALWGLQAALERVLVAPFKQDYPALLADARARLRRKAGL